MLIQAWLGFIVWFIYFMNLLFIWIKYWLNIFKLIFIIILLFIDNDFSNFLLIWIYFLDSIISGRNNRFNNLLIYLSIIFYKNLLNLILLYIYWWFYNFLNSTLNILRLFGNILLLSFFWKFLFYFWWKFIYWQPFGWKFILLFLIYI